MTCAQLADVTSRDRHRDSVPVGEADHRGADGVEFHGSAGLGVALHRRTHAGRNAVEEGQDLLVVTDGSFGSGDGGHLGHESAQVVAVALPDLAGRGLLVRGEEGDGARKFSLLQRTSCSLSLSRTVRPACSRSSASSWTCARNSSTTVSSTTTNGLVCSTTPASGGVDSTRMGAGTTLAAG